LLQVVQLGCHVEQLLLLRFCQDDVRIAVDAQRLGLDRLSVDHERDVVGAGQHHRSRRGATPAAEPTTAPPPPAPPPPPPAPAPRPTPSGSPAAPSPLPAPCPPPAPPAPSAPLAPRAPPAPCCAGSGCTRRSQHAELMPALTAFDAIAISRTFLPSASVIFS